MGAAVHKCRLGKSCGVDSQPVEGVGSFLCYKSGGWWVGVKHKESKVHAFINNYNIVSSTLPQQA